MRWWKGRIMALGLAALMVVAGCGGGAPAQPEPVKVTMPAVPAKKDKIRVAFSSISAAQVIPLLAKEAGIFDKYGIDAEIIFISGSSKLTQAMVAGDIPFSAMGGQAMAEANVAGADTVMVAGSVYTLLFYVMTTPDIKSPQDLKGKQIGITRYGTASHFAARYALKYWGLDPDKDVAMVQLNDMPGILAGMKSGAVQAGILSSPTNVKAEAQGYKSLAFLGDLGLEYQQTGVVTTRRQIEKNPELVQRFVQAYTEGLHRFKTDKPFALKMIGELTKTEDPNVLEQTYTVYEPLMAKVPHPSLKGMQTILEEMAEQKPEAKSVKPESLIDDRFVKAMEESGFTRQLWGN